MASGGQIPRKIGDFNTYVKRVIPYLANNANKTRLGVSNANKNYLTDALGDSDTAGTWIYLWKKTNNKATCTVSFRTDRNKLQKTISAKLREVYNDIPESALTESDRTTLLIPERKTKRSPRPKISTRPSLKLLVRGGARFTVENRVESDSSRPSMHPDANYIELRYCIQETPPTSIKECNITKILSKARETLKLDPDDARKTIYCYTRWANKTDETKSSRWTRMHSAVISD